ncbi:MAG: substrate-binding domain-containing protein [Propionibacteriales bacterium]|nr:substrate-binding domain-containing protein [Propionibacteriales bacterium]
MKNTRTSSALVALAAVAVLGLAACSGSGGKQEEEKASGGNNAAVADTPRVKIAMITHEAPGDTFWDLIRKGAEAAAAKDNVELIYSNDPQAPKQASLIQTAIDSDVDAIATTLSNPDALGPVVQKAVEAGIPVVEFNAGVDSWEDTGALMYFGQDETVAGQAVGERLNEEGAKNAMCVIQEQGQVQLEARCAGVEETFSGKTQKLYVNGRDMPSVGSNIEAKLAQDKTIDRVVTLGAPFALAAVQSVEGAGSSAQVVTFDTNADLVAAIEAGDVQWAIDQQPYLQGYEAIDSLWLYLTNGNIIGGGEAVLTGPSFIDQENIDTVAEYAKRGTR